MCKAYTNPLSLYMGLGIFILFFGYSPASAQEHIHEKINEVTDKLSQYPDSAELYVLRAELNKINENFSAAYMDVKMAELLNPALPEIPLMLAQVFAAQGMADMGLVYIDTFLNRHPSNPEGLYAKADIQTQRKDHKDALECFKAAIDLTSVYEPEQFVKLARSTMETDSLNFEGAIFWLNMGEQKLGFNLLLRMYAIDLKVKKGDINVALSDLDEIIDRAPRKEKWLMKKARINEEAGRVEEAIKCYEQALQIIEKLPTNVRNSRLVMEWEGDAITAILKLKEEKTEE